METPKWLAKTEDRTQTPTWLKSERQVILHTSKFESIWDGRKESSEIGEEPKALKLFWS